MKKNVWASLSFSVLSALVAFVSACLGSCGEKPSDVEEFKLEKTDFTDWSHLLHVESVTQLKESDSCLMSYAKKCIVTDKNIIFWDYKAKRIYSFDMAGNFICQIGRLGHSGSEYADLTDICMSEDNSSVLVLDGRGILCYNADNGKFVERKKFASQEYGEYERFAHIGASDFLCYTDSRNNSSIVLDAAKGCKGLRESKRFHFGVNYFYRYNDNLRVLPDYGDFYIDGYDDGRLHTLYKFDLGSKALPEDVLPKTFEEFNVVDNSPEYFKCITNACETTDWLYVRFVGPKQEYYTAFINKKTKGYAFGHDVQSLGMDIIGAKDGYFYALVYPDFVAPESAGKKILEKHNVSSGGAGPVVVKFVPDETAL